ncbi:MAG: imidazole glycerol phosphate synthase subunit HisF [Halobacteriales archaeon]
MIKRIVPCMDAREGTLVKGVNFEGVREVGDPVEVAEEYDAQGADELCYLDIAATPTGRETMLETVERIAERIAIPLTVGGGIRSVDDAAAAFDAGADKVSINTAAVKDPTLLGELADTYGRQAVVCAIDADRDGDAWVVYTGGGREPTDRTLFEWGATAVDHGAGEILYTGIHTDGTTDGYDVEGTRRLSETVDVPIIASGGAGTLEHFAEVLTAGRADAALAASVFHFGTYTVGEVKRHLDERGVEVRL